MERIIVPLPGPPALFLPLVERLHPVPPAIYRDYKLQPASAEVGGAAPISLIHVPSSS